MYEKASNALLDDYEEVRMAGVKIIWVMSHIYPERCHFCSNLKIFELFIEYMPGLRMIAAIIGGHM